MVLIYRTSDSGCLELVRLGSHSELDFWPMLRYAVLIIILALMIYECLRIKFKLELQRELREAHTVLIHEYVGYPEDGQTREERRASLRRYADNQTNAKEVYEEALFRVKSKGRIYKITAWTMGR